MGDETDETEMSFRSGTVTSSYSSLLVNDVAGTCTNRNSNSHENWW